MLERPEKNMSVGMIKTYLNQDLRASCVKYYLLGIVCLICATDSTAQNISATDISALKGGVTLQGGTASALGGSNLSSMLAIQVPSMGLHDDEDQLTDGKKIKHSSPPLLPNEFQKYVTQTTGQWLPLYGSEFFENLKNNNAQFTRSPVSDDYVIGAGDQLLIRVWGSTNAEAAVTVDRQGAIAFPKLGTLRLAGVRAGQLDAVVKSYFNKYYRTERYKYHNH